MGGSGKSNAAGTKYGYIVTNLNLGAEPNDCLAYALGLELHHLIMSKLGGHGDRLEREIGPYEKFQTWKNGTVTLRVGAFTKRVNIYRIKP